MSIYLCCPKCGSENFLKDGFIHTAWVDDDIDFDPVYEDFNIHIEYCNDCHYKKISEQ